MNGASLIFYYGKLEYRQVLPVLETVEMGHYGTVQILKRRTDKKERGPRRMSRASNLIIIHRILPH